MIVYVLHGTVQQVGTKIYSAVSSYPFITPPSARPQLTRQARLSGVTKLFEYNKDYYFVKNKYSTVPAVTVLQQQMHCTSAVQYIIYILYCILYILDQNKERISKLYSNRLYSIRRILSTTHTGTCTLEYRTLRVPVHYVQSTVQSEVTVLHCFIQIQ